MPPENKDYYKVLQVDPSADPEVIEAAYRRLARKYHPDMNKSSDATLRMQKINTAYGILRHPVKRAQYDQERSSQSAWSDSRYAEERHRREKAEADWRHAEAEAARRQAEEDRGKREEREETRHRAEQERRMREETEATARRTEDKKQRFSLSYVICPRCDEQNSGTSWYLCSLWAEPSCLQVATSESESGSSSQPHRIFSQSDRIQGRANRPSYHLPQVQ